MRDIDWLADTLRHSSELHPTAADVAVWLDCSRATARRCLRDLEAAEVIQSYRRADGYHWCSVHTGPLGATPETLIVLREMGEATTATYARRTGRTPAAALRALVRLRAQGLAVSSGWPCVFRAVA